MSAPSSYIASAISFPLTGSLKPEKSGGTDAYLEIIVISGLTDLTPCMNPASKAWINGISTPPTKPTTFLLFLERLLHQQDMNLVPQQKPFL